MLDHSQVKNKTHIDTDKIIINFKDKQMECLRSKFEEQQEYIAELMGLLRQEEEKLKNLMETHKKTS